MKKRLLGIIAIMLLATIAFSSCTVLDTVKDFLMGILLPAVELDDAALSTEKIIDFENGANPELFFESGEWANGSVFNVVWTKSNVKFEDKVLKLGITEEKKTAWLDGKEVEFNYTAGELRSEYYYTYGDYEVSMKPSANPGTASTFFTCAITDEKVYQLDEEGNIVLDENGLPIGTDNPHDEIDIEFLGNDTTKVQFNFFVNGKGNNEYMHDLGFDASEGFHTYGFRWEPTSITWFVDNVPVYKVTTDTSVTEAKNLRIVDAIPAAPSKILANYWCGTSEAEGWMGKYEGAKEDNGPQYQWFGTSAEGAPLNPEYKPETEGDKINWSEIEAITPTFQSTNEYTVAIDGKKTDVTYTAVPGGGYANINMNVSAPAAGNNYIRISITNNGTTASKVRVNLYKGIYPNSTQLNVSATQDGEEVYTDTQYGGSMFEISAGTTAELIVKYAVGVETLELMLDSHTDGDSNTYAGNLTVNDIKFGKIGDVPTPHECVDDDGDGKCDGCDKDMPKPAPQVPASGDTSTTINGVEVTFRGNMAETYGVNANDENNTVNIKYNAATNNYHNIEADVSSFAGTKNIFYAKITNNGTETVNVRIDINSETKLKNTTACNVSATQDGVGVFTNDDWGGSMFTVAPGQTIEVEIVYDPSRVVTNLMFYLDTHIEDNVTRSGDVTISDMEFKGEYSGGENPPAASPVEFYTWNDSGYTVDKVDGKFNVTYTGPFGAYLPIKADVASLAKGNDTFTVTIKNNGTESVHIRIDIQGQYKLATAHLEGSSTTSGTDACNVSATASNGAYVHTDSVWGGSSVEVGAGETVTLTVTYNENSYQGAVQSALIFVDAAKGGSGNSNANVTISDAAFSKTCNYPSYVNSNIGFELWSTDKYTCVNNGTSSTVSYSDVSGTAYSPIGAWIGNVSTSCNRFAFTVTNTGDSKVHLRSNIQVKHQDENVQEIAQTIVEIEAGQTVVVIIDFVVENETDVLNNAMFYIDCARGDGTYAGSVTISNLQFTTV